MTLRVEEVARLHPQPGAPSGTPADRSLRPRAAMPRRAFLAKVALTTCAAISVQVLGVFPQSRKALADGYDVWSGYLSGPCGPGGYAVPHNCSPGCGPSTVCGGGNDGPCCSGGWHKNQLQYYLRPNQCFAGWADAWRWRCSTNGNIYRCHDGWTVYVRGGTVRSICRHVT